VTQDWRKRLLVLLSQRMPGLSRRLLASAGYTLDVSRYGETDVWSRRTAERQDRAWLPLIEQAKAGHPREDIAALQSALSGLPRDGTLLEVGCGGGYNSEIVALTSPGQRYTGLDVSPAMVARCRTRYPRHEFVVGSAYELPFEDGAFDVVLDGVALIHMTEWARAVAEYARVSRGAIVLHGVTVTDSAPTTRFAKYAYGQPTTEFVVARVDIEQAVADAGLRLVRTLPAEDYDLEPFLGIPSVSETWVLSRT